MTKLTALFLLCLIASTHISAEPLSFSINTKKWSHVLDDHFISITVNPTDLLQGRVYGLAMNSTLSILKGLAPAYVRIGSADTGKYTFKKSRYPNDMIKPEDEYTVTETHWMVFNEVAHSAGLDVIVCLNAAHRIEGTKKWDTRNSLELISFSDSQGYNLTWQLGYEVQSGEELSGIQFGKDLNRLRTILNAFPRYQHAKLIGPDIRVIHKKEDIDFWNDVLIEAGPTLDAVTWHPRWPQPSKMKVSDNSDLGYEFPSDYLEWDRNQLNKILQRSIFKNPVWIGETKRESTGTFAEGLIWARRLVLAAKLGIEVVMKQPNLMDITHPKPEYWIALLHKRLLGKSVLETRSVTNHTDLAVIAHCTNPGYWSDKPEKLQDGPISVYGVNMGGLEQKFQIKGTWNGKSQLLFQYVLTSGSDPDSVFSQMTYLNGEPILMTDDGNLPDIIPKIKKFERGLTMKLPPYSVGFWVVPEARVKICQVQPQNIPTINIETLTPSLSHKAAPNNLQNIRDINQFLVDKLTNPVEESNETPEVKIEPASSESSEKDINSLSKEINTPRVARRIRQVRGLDGINRELKTIMEETQALFAKPKEMSTLEMKLPKATPTMEHRIQSIAQGISDAIKSTNQQQEFDKFLQDSGLKQDFGALMMNDRKFNAPGIKNIQVPNFQLEGSDLKARLKRSIKESEDYSAEESGEKSDEQSEEEFDSKFKSEKYKPNFGKKITLVKEEEEKKNRKPDLVVPHNPDIKGLEEKYKSVIQSKLQDEKRKIDDIKRKIKQEEVEVNKKIKPPETVTDIREEIIKKEIQLIEKTEETVADILKSQKKRQETFGDIIFDELNDVKEERMSALEEIQKNQKRKENTIVKRHSPTPLSAPILKTVEYIEKNFNLEPESVRKIKRSLEEKMGEILRNYDTKKSLETRKRLSSQKDDKKVMPKKSYKDDESKSDTFSKQTYSERSEKTDDTRSYHFNKDRPKDKNIIRKGIISPPKLSHSSGRGMRKMETEDSDSSRESTYKNSRNEERKKSDDTVNSSFESHNEKKPQEMVRKFDRRRTYNEPSDEKTSKYIKKDSKDSKLFEKDEYKKTKPEFDIRKKFKEDKTSEPKKKEVVEEEEVAYTEEKKVPLKNDKQRRENMLKHITSMVEHINSDEENDGKSKRLSEDEDISEEFESDRRSTKIKRRPRKAEFSDFQFLSPPSERLPEQNIDTFLPTESPITSSTPAGKVSKLKKHRIRPNRKPKITKPNDEEDTIQKKRHLTNLARPLLELEKKKLLKPKIRKLHPKVFRGGNELLISDKDKEVIDAKNLMIPENPVNVPVLATEAPKKNEEEIVKELEEMVQQKHFLGQDTEPSKKESEIRGKNFLEDQKETEMNFSGETPTPTEGYIIVEPTIEMETKGIITTEKPIESATKSSSEAKDSSEDKYKKSDDFKKPRSDSDSEKEEKPIVAKQPKKENSVSATKSSSEAKDSSEDKYKKSDDFKKPRSDSDSEKEEKPIVAKQPKKENSEEKEQPQESENMFSTQEESSEEMVSETENLSSLTNANKNENEDTSSLENESFEKAKPMESENKIIESPEISKNDPTELTVKNKNDAIELLQKNKKDISELSTKIQELMKEDSERFSDTEETNSHKTQRKRRATFVENHEDEDDEDYSSEERIKKFKQMVYRKSPAKKPVHNEVRSRGSFGAADELLRMAGSTVRVMFDDVIPEAYGQTKTKIQNMGISEYIKEFGKIVQQMKNLDQIFLNIGEAAVKGYIRGNRAEKGPYIQVISRKKRSLSNEDIQKENDPVHFPSSETDTTEELVPIAGTEKTETPIRPDVSEEVSEQTILTTDSSTEKVTSETHSQLDSTETDHYTNEKPDEKYGATRSSETRTTGRSIISSEPRSGAGNQREVEEKNRKKEEEEKMAQKVLDTSLTSSKELTTRTEQSDDKQSSDIDVNGNKPKILKKVPKLAKRVSTKLRKYEKSDSETGIADNDPKMNLYLTNEMQEKLTPWIKTTKDFIQQALTTLQRQKQLTEIIARESINDLMSRDETTKTIGKREADMDEPKLPVFHTISSKSNKKRETYQKQTEESLIQQLKGLHPGVYVVPTEEMTNIRSEQFTNEAKEKSGLPNVVTLNIYYDKKNQIGSPKTDAATQVTDPIVTYYQNKAWNAAEAQYGQNNQYVSPMAVPEVNIQPPVLAPVASPIQTAVYAPEPKIANIPNSRLIQYPTPTFHYPPTQKIYPSILAKNAQPVFSPVFYVQPDTRFVPQPPGTKRQWYEFKARNPAVQTGAPGWSIQYETVPGSLKAPLKGSFNKHFKMLSDKKRSVGDFKMDPKWSEAALPFWKFFATSEKNEENVNGDDSRENLESVSAETESSEDIFEENRKRAKEAEEKNNKVTEEEPVKEEEKTEKSKSRKRRSVSETNKNELPNGLRIRKLVKRSYPYTVEFRDHDVLPEWFGTYQEIENTLEDLSPHIRRSHIVSTPWSDEDDELLSILDADDELALAGINNDDYYYGNENAIGHLRRYRRSTDQSESSMLKTNMIYKAPMDNQIFKNKIFGKTGMKKLGDEDNSLELITKPKVLESGTKSPEFKPVVVQPERQQENVLTQTPQIVQLMTPKPQPLQQQKLPLQSQQPQQPQPPQQPAKQPQQTVPQLPPNGILLPRNPNDDTFYYFFKYAYDSLVKVMKSMTELF